MLGARQQVYFNVCKYVWLISSLLVLGALAEPESGKCEVFDAFKVLPANSTNYVGGAFALHKQDCKAIIGESVQEIVALQWIFAHWNNAQKALSLFVGDSCSRPKESILQTLRYLDFINFYEPKECTKKAKNGSMTGVLAPKDRQSASALAGVLQSTNLIVGAYTSESVEALLKGGVKRVLTTSAVIEDYISAFSALMSSLESDLVIVVTCDEENPRLDTVLKLLNEQQIHAKTAVESREIDNGPKLLVTLGISHLDDVHFPYRIANAQEIIIRQIRTELPQFKPYFLRILSNNYDTYALASSYIQQLVNCSFANKTCPPINLDSLSTVYVQGKNVDAIVRLAYAFAVASRFVDVDQRLKTACSTSSAACVDGVFQQLSSMRFINEKRSPLELSNEELGFFPKSEHLLQSIGIRLEAVLGGSQEEVFKYVVAREPKLISKGVPASIRQVRSVCQPYHTYCGNCEQAILADPKTTFLNNQQVASFYLAALFDLHDEGCENIKQESIVNALAVTYTMNTMLEKHPKIALRPLKDYGAIIFDSCSDNYRSRQFTINTETQCLKLPLTEYNVSIPASTILSYISTLDEPDNQASLLHGMHIPAAVLDSPVVDRQNQNGVVGLLPPAKSIAQAVAEFLQAMQWDFISVVVSSTDTRSLNAFEAFTSIAQEYNLCVGNVLFYSPQNRTRLNSHQSQSNVTVFFTTGVDASEFVSTRLRFNVELANNVDVMVGGAQDFFVHNPNMLLQHSGTIAIRQKDILPSDFKEFMQNVTPLSLPEQYYWSYVEKTWRCALSLQNRAQFEGRLCTGNEHLNLLEFGGTGRSMDRAYKKACVTETNIGFCEEFLINGRRLIREELNAENFEVGFQVDEFQPLDHHGNQGYKKIGNFTADYKYVEVEQYRVFVSGVPKYDSQHMSSCNSPLCVCKQQKMPKVNLDAMTAGLNSKYGSVKWYQADKTALLFEWESSTLNIVLLVITSVIICLTAATLLIVLYKIYTRSIKGNQSLGVFSLFGILLLDFTCFLYIMDSKDQVYDLRSMLNSIGHVICFGLVLLKAIRLRNFEDICNKRKLQIGLNYWLMLLFIISVQVAISFNHLESVSLRESVSQGYTAFLLFMALLINVQNRKILRNYKESKWLFTVSLFALSLYSIWAVTRTLLPVYSRQIDILELQLLSLILLIFLFGPKLYILLFFEGVVVERSETPIKPHIYEDDLFATSSPDLSSRSNASRKGSIGHKSASTVTADEFPVLKTVMRKKRDGPSMDMRHSHHSSDRNSTTSSN
ncbi:G-PROTEIN-RECEP-F3-4 domain-containing protein [Aphelenchoides bicaudatus]|nr:G-PROTEIN-RECEP-F3-4 domain-containing protein [Aphelenchoides bicaudatus]